MICNFLYPHSKRVNASLMPSSLPTFKIVNAKTTSDDLAGFAKYNPSALAR
jgi:hypothetical protein